jgi:hypothetical protein
MGRCMSSFTIRVYRAIARGKPQAFRALLWQEREGWGMNQLILWNESDPDNEEVFTVLIRDEGAFEQIKKALREAGIFFLCSKIATLH